MKVTETTKETVHTADAYVKDLSKRLELVQNTIGAVRDSRTLLLAVPKTYVEADHKPSKAILELFDILGTKEQYFNIEVSKEIIDMGDGVLVYELSLTVTKNSKLDKLQELLNS